MKTLLALLLLACCNFASAAMPLPVAPATGWCYDFNTSIGYNGVKACPTVIIPLVIGQDYFENIRGTVPNPRYCATGDTCPLGTSVTGW